MKKLDIKLRLTLREALLLVVNREQENEDEESHDAYIKALESLKGYMNHYISRVDPSYFVSFKEDNGWDYSRISINIFRATGEHTSEYVGNVVSDIMYSEQKSEAIIDALDKLMLYVVDNSENKFNHPHIKIHE